MPFGWSYKRFIIHSSGVFVRLSTDVMFGAFKYFIIVVFVVELDYRNFVHMVKVLGKDCLYIVVFEWDFLWRGGDIFCLDLS